MVGFAMWMGLFGQVGQLWQWDLCWPVLLMIGIVALGLWTIIKVKRWRDEFAEAGVFPLDEEIDHYEKMVADGLLEPEELARIKAKVDARANLPGTEEPKPQPDQPPETSIQEK